MTTEIKRIGLPAAVLGSAPCDRISFRSFFCMSLLMPPRRSFSP